MKGERLEAFGDVLARFTEGKSVGVCDASTPDNEFPRNLTAAVQVNHPIPIPDFADQGEIEAVVATYQDNGYSHVVVRMRDTQREYCLRLLTVV